MTRKLKPQKKPGQLGAMLCYSAIAHVAFFLLLCNVHFPAHFKEAPVYYVDILDLPVANPQAGMPGSAAAPPAPPQPVAPAPRQMTIPAQPLAKPSPTKAAAEKEKRATETAREFDERITRLAKEAAARHASAALEALKAKGSTVRAGMPGATGTEAGVDYASYIQSRLRDAFKTTIAFQSKNPEVVVRLTINKAGIISRLRIERSSGDKIFEDAVKRAIAAAEKNFPPLPRGDEFENGYVFRPQGVGKN